MKKIYLILLKRRFLNFLTRKIKFFVCGLFKIFLVFIPTAIFIWYFNLTISFPFTSKWIDNIQYKSVRSWDANGETSAALYVTTGQNYTYVEPFEIKDGNKKFSILTEKTNEMSNPISLQNPLYSLFRIPSKIFSDFQFCINNLNTNLKGISVSKRDYVDVIFGNPQRPYHSYYSNEEQPSSSCQPFTETGKIIQFTLFIDANTHTGSIIEHGKKYDGLTTATLSIEPVYQQLWMVIWFGSFIIVGNICFLFAKFFSNKESSFSTTNNLPRNKKNV